MTALVGSTIAASSDRGDGDAPPAAIDLGDLTHALQDHSDDHEWWFDPSSGKVVYRSELVRDELDEVQPEERGLLLVEPVASHDAYGDMVDFAARVPEHRDELRRAHEELAAALPLRPPQRRGLPLARSSAVLRGRPGHR